MKFLAVSERRGLVRSRVGRAAKLLTVDLRGKQGDIPVGRLEPGPRDLAVGTSAGVCVRVRSGAVAASEKVTAPSSVTKKEEEMTGTLDWKWIVIGVVVMVVLNLIAGLILGLFLAPQLKGVASPEDVELSGGQIVLAALLNFLAFAIGGFIVGIKSAGRTILEPGISAAVAVLIVLLISGNFTVVNLLAVGLVPFIAGLLGGWLGERRPRTV
jgi:hypothetical protein